MPVMARWADVRVPSEDGADCLILVVGVFPGSLVQYDPSPAASGPEVEISVRGAAEAELVGCIEREGYDVLASRTRLGPWTEPDEEVSA